MRGLVLLAPLLAVTLSTPPAYAQTAGPAAGQAAAPAQGAPAAAQPPAQVAPPTQPPAQVAPPTQPPAPFPQGAKFAYVNLQAVAQLSVEGKAANAKVQKLTQ